MRGVCGPRSDCRALVMEDGRMPINQDDISTSTGHIKSKKTTLGKYGCSPQSGWAASLSQPFLPR